MKGTFYGIGVGPGDPELLTMKAVKAIQKVDIIIAPKTEKKDGSVALNIARPYLKEDVRIVYQVFPMVKGFALDDAAWKQNKEEILGFLEEGKNVAFLTLGDAMFFSTYIYVFRKIEKEGVPISMMYWILPRSSAAPGSFMAAGVILPVSGVGAPAITQ